MTDDRPDQATVEARLRAALAERAAHIEPSPGGLDRIEEELMEDRPTDDRRKWLIGAISAAAAVLLVVIGVFVLADDDDAPTDVTSDSSTSSTSTTSTTEATTTTTTETTTTTTFAPTVDPFTVAFPDPRSSRRFDSPVAAAQTYATDVLGFTDLEVGEFRQGDSRSGEVPITDRADGPETQVLVRQMDDESWFVLGSTTGDITVDEPAAGDEVSSPFSTTGTALAFEGNVGVLVLTQSDPGTPIGEGFVTGSGVPPAGPFEGEISFEPPTGETPGILVYRTQSAEDGHVQEAASFPVRLLPG